jgi:hypothetical protein
MNAVKIAVLILGTSIVLAAVAVYSGLYNFAGDDTQDDWHAGLGIDPRRPAHLVDGGIPAEAS